MKRLAVIALLLVSATCASTATADVPSGFVESPAVEARAAWVSQKAVQVYCADNDADWAAYIDTIGTPSDFPNGAASAFGYTPVIGGTVAYLAPATCAAINARLGRHHTVTPALGAALYVLTLESFHMEGDTNDGVTACDAIHRLPSFLVAPWRFKKNGPAYMKAMASARNFLGRQPSQYHTAGC